MNNAIDRFFSNIAYADLEVLRSSFSFVLSDAIKRRSSIGDVSFS